MRVARKTQTTGSEHWLRTAVEEQTVALDDSIRRAFRLGEREEIYWRSPIREDEFAEYRDQTFLDRLNLNKLSVPLSSFWPRRGPQWDGLARTSTGRVILVEAKAYKDEVQDGGTAAASEVSRELIQRSLSRAQTAFQAQGNVDWTTRYYQYVNRLAHLYFLRELNGCEAYLLFLNFADAPDRSNATSAAGWRKHSSSVLASLGLTGVNLPYVADLIWSVPDMQAGIPANLALEGMV